MVISKRLNTSVSGGCLACDHGPGFGGYKYNFPEWLHMRDQQNFHLWLQFVHVTKVVMGSSADRVCIW